MPRSSSWLWLTLVALSALLAAELRYAVGTGPGVAAVGEGSAPVEAAPPALFALADRDRYSETLERPLFMPNRQPPGAAAPKQAARAARPDARRYALSAIIIVDDERIALVTDTATGGLSRVREGESFADWQVEEISESSAVLSNGDVREELTLRTFGAPAPRPQPSRQQAADRAAGFPDKRDNVTIPDRPRRPKRGLRQTRKAPQPASN